MDEVKELLDDLAERISWNRDMQSELKFCTNVDARRWINRRIQLNEEAIVWDRLMLREIHREMV